jgi:G3E family GTPase
LSEAGQNKIPCYLVTGFLGSGKTTFLKQVLERFGDSRKLAIVQNEFAPASIDGTDLKQVSKPFEILEINNGSVFCVCLLSDFKSSLSQFIREHHPDAVFLEASGLADPIAVAEVLQAEELKDLLYLAYIWTVVDVPNFLRLKTMVKRLTHQVAVADRVILNKTDLADDQMIDKVRSAVQEINPFAEISTATYCTFRFEKDVFAGEARLVDRLSGYGAGEEGDDPEKNACGRPEIGFGVLRSARRISRENLEQFISEFAKHTYRIKGYVRLKEGTVLAVQTSFDQIHFEEIKEYPGNTELIAMGDMFNLGRFSERYHSLAKQEVE